MSTQTTEYPVAEMFHSIQGEGLFAGTPMFFIRLAGCNVGKYDNPETAAQSPLGALRIAHPKLSICTSALGQQFLCDTDYHCHTKEMVSDLCSQPFEEHVCITGGEPFLHDLDPLVDMLAEMGKMVHIETSGTLPFPKWVGREEVWITCSPKHPFLSDNARHVAEWKFVVDSHMDLEEITDKISKLVELNPETLVYLQPINDVVQLDMKNNHFVLRILKNYPEWRMSIQMHKVLGLR